MSDLSARHSRHGAAKLSADEVQRYLGELEGWELSSDGNSIHSTFQFDDYYRTIAFVNAVAFIANREDHHPDLEVSYSRCRVRFSTHDAGGLTENDFICAARILELSS